MKSVFLSIILFTGLLCQGAFAQSTVLSNGVKDTTMGVSVLGAVNHPGLVYISSDGSLIEAIAACGGWLKTANTKKVYVLHGKPGEKAERTEYDVNQILEAQKPNPKLSSGDIVYVLDRVF